MFNDKKENIIKCIKNSGILLLFVIASEILITSVLYFIHIPITKYHLPIIYLMVNVIFVILFRKSSSYKSLLVSLLIGIIVFSSSIMYSGTTYDLTIDGNSYHKLAIGSLKNGWNPVYTNNEDFNKEQGNAIDIDTSRNKVVLWTNHYTKGTWIFSAVVYAFTNNIESGKALTILLMYICYTLVFSYLSKKINLIGCIIIPLVLVINPITIVQVNNYYIDGILGLSLFIIIYSLITITDKKIDITKFEKLFVLSLALVICINVKFTGLAFAGIFCFMFYLYWLYESKKESKEKFINDFKFYTIYYFIVVFVSVCLVGYTSYVKNTIEHGHPFYPLYGEGKVDIITTMQPNYFSERNVIQKFLISLFSKGENVGYSYERDDLKPTLKIPFTFTRSEINNYNIPDIRIGGFGPLFSGIMIISVLVTLYAIYELVKIKEKNILIPYLLILFGIVILLLIVDGSWWARYTPYLMLVPILASIFLMYNGKKHKLKVALGIVLTIILAVNSCLLIGVTYRSYKRNGRYIERMMDNFIEYSKNQEITKIKLNSTDFQGILYNIIDKDISIEIDKEMETTNAGYFFTY